SVDCPILPSFPTRRSSDLILATRSAFGRDQIFAGQDVKCLTLVCHLGFTLPSFIKTRPFHVRMYIKFPLAPAISVWCDRLLQQRSEEHTSELQSRVDLVCR